MSAVCSWPPKIARSRAMEWEASIDSTAGMPQVGSAGGAKKVFVKTYGCQMNVYDSQRMADALAEDGYVATETMEEADLVLLNTCHIREKAAEKVYSELGRIRKLKAERAARGRDTMVGVAGCVAQAEGQEIIRRASVVDLVIGPQTYHRIGEAVRKARAGEKVVETDYAIEDKFEHLPALKQAEVRTRGVTAFLTVQEGCDKFCTFCVVPYTRGAEVSRPVSQIVAEAERLAEAGVREVTLLGQNVNAWHGEGAGGREWGLGELLFRLAEIPGLARLRYTTSHPRDMDDALIAAHRDLPALMPYLHLPVQAGSDRILKAMNRRHTAADYLRLVERIRAARSDIAMSGDFIVGFPGETGEDFEATMRLVREVGYAQAFSFKYSPRPGTPGAELKDQVAEAVKDERLPRLQALLAEQQRSFAIDLAGKEIDLLIEKPGRAAGQMVGRSPWLQPVIVDAAAGGIGDIVKVRITRASAGTLFGEAA
jgi:tRNA-2-methylthio-N6-dimethylallyladenosine synthase